MDPLKKLKFIENEKVSGYTLSSIKESFNKARFDEFQKWMFGETMAIYKNEYIVSKIHINSFMNGSPPLAL